MQAAQLSWGEASAGGGVGSAASSDIEKAWISRSLAGDVTAFEAIFRLYYPHLCAFAERFVHSPDAARDAVQDVFVSVWEQRQSCEGCENLRAYLFTAVRNRSLKLLRHQGVVQRGLAQMTRDLSSPGTGAPPATPEDHARVAELAQAVERVIEQLPERCREAYLLHRQQGMSYAEIAEVMGVSARTVENHIARALRGLREGLAAWIS